MSFHVNLLTLFPDMFPSTLGQSLAGKALDKKIWSYRAINIRDFADDIHRTVDDAPFGGGAGMVMKADVLERAYLSLPHRGRFIYMSPRGRVLNQNLVKELSRENTLTILCGRYEGVDERFLEHYQAEEISVGDYVLSGGEIAALTLLDACIRLLPGVMGNLDTAPNESFENNLLEHPHYTRPQSWQTADGTILNVPDVLRSGHHDHIQKWRHDQSRLITRARRPDLLSKID
jgi:tRNA (guanine37-N1)-methyltransferase